MNIRIKQLRDFVVALDRVDRKLDSVDAAAYRSVASAALALTHEQMGLLPMADFAGPVNSLQTLAENIHFSVNGRFADVDGTGRAPKAAALASALECRMRDCSPERGQEIADGLFARLSNNAVGGVRITRS